MSYENLRPATDENGHPITQSQWNRVMVLLASWHDSRVSAAHISAECKAILAENAGE